VSRHVATPATRGSAKRPGMKGRQPQFSADEILAKIREWATLHGEPPSMSDWEPSRARRLGQPWRAERFEDGNWPSVRMVVAQFGRFNDAVAKAGVAPRRRPSRIKPRLSGPEQILVAIREWAARYGEPPTMADWDPVRARRLKQEWRFVRYRAGDWPSLNTLLYHFGSLGAAVRAAGLAARPAGLHARDAAEYRALTRRLVALEASADEEPGATVADALRHVAHHRATEDQEALHHALLMLASAALRWADGVTAADVDSAPGAES
jgi:hypothetical protein